MSVKRSYGGDFGGPLAVERLGRELVLDNGILLTPPNPFTNDLYVGRLLVGSSDLSLQLHSEDPSDSVIEAYGQLVVPYIPRRIFKDQEDCLNSARRVLDSVNSVPVQPAEVEIHDSTIKVQRNGKQFAVRIALRTVIPGIINDEMDRAYRSVKRQLAEVSLKPMPLCIRAYETASHDDAKAVQTLIHRFLPPQTMTNLTIPILCGVPKNN